MKSVKDVGVRGGGTGYDAGSLPKQDSASKLVDPTVTSTVPSSEADRQRNSSAFKAHVPGASSDATNGTAAVSTEPVKLKPEQLDTLVKLKGVCPFIGSAMATGALPIRNSPDKPLASIDDVVKLGNSGGGDLGKVLALFANGNHALMAGPSGKLDTEVPPGTFSLDLAGSQGSHPGHSGILNGNPLELNAGRMSTEDWGRLESRAKDGFIKRSDLGKFIAENVLRDPSSKVLGPRTLLKLGADALAVAGRTPAAAFEALANVFRKNDTHEAGRDALEAVTKLLGEENIAGAAGEFALLFAMLANKPGAKEIDGEPALALEDLKLMFIDKKFPEGWERWPKNASDWAASTAALTLEAGKEYVRLRHDRSDGIF